MLVFNYHAILAVSSLSNLVARQFCLAPNNKTEQGHFVIFMAFSVCLGVVISVLDRSPPSVVVHEPNSGMPSTTAFFKYFIS